MACNLPRTRIIGMDAMMRKYKITNILLADRAGVNACTIDRARHEKNILVTHACWIQEALILLIKERQHEQRDSSKNN